MCDVCSQPAKAQYCSRVCEDIAGHFQSEPADSQTLGKVLEKAMKYLQTPVKVTLPALHQVALEECKGNLHEARIVYEMAGAAIQNFTQIQRSNSVFDYILRQAGVGEKALKQINRLKEEHLELQQKISLAFLKRSQEDLKHVPTYLRQCDANMRTIHWLITTSLGKKPEEPDSETTVNDQVAEFLVAYMELKTEGRLYNLKSQ